MINAIAKFSRISILDVDKKQFQFRTCTILFSSTEILALVGVDATVIGLPSPKYKSN